MPGRAGLSRPCPEQSWWAAADGGAEGGFAEQKAKGAMGWMISRKINASSPGCHRPKVRRRKGALVLGTDLDKRVDGENDELGLLLGVVH